MLTVSFLREFFLKSCHQQSSQSSLSAYASVLQGDTLSKQSNLLIPPVFISRKNPARTKPRQTARNSKHCPCWGKYGHRLMNQKKPPLTQSGHWKTNVYSKPARAQQLILQPQGSLPEEGCADLDCSCDLSCLCSRATWWAEQAAPARHESCRVNPGGNQHISSLAWLPWSTSHAAAGDQQSLSTS